MAETALAFRKASDLGGISIASSPDIFEKKVRLWTPWYIIKQAFTLHEFDDQSIRKGYNKEIQEENDYLAKQMAERKQKQTQKSIAALDKQLKLIDLKLKMVINGLFFSLNTNYDARKAQPHRNLLQLKTEPIDILMVKHGHKYGFSVLGIQLMTQSSFELLFQFSLQIQKAFSIYLDNPVLKDSKKFYEELVYKRVRESNKLRGMDGSFTGFDGSTIRHTGASGMFSNRYSAFAPLMGSRYTSGAMGRSTRKTGISNVPRNKPTLDFSVIQNVRPETKVTRNEPPINMQSPARQTPMRTMEAKSRDFDDSFENEGTLSDTDEEVKNTQREVKQSASKPKNKKAKTTKYVHHEERDFPEGGKKVIEKEKVEMKRRPDDIARDIKSPSVMDVDKSPSHHGPRTAPSRRQRRMMATQRVPMEPETTVSIYKLRKSNF